MTAIEQHDQLWNDRIQELLDGEIASSERASTESHLAGCGRCRAQYVQFKRLDAKLAVTLDVVGLDKTFDRQLYARIESLDANSRQRAQRRLERELQEDLEQLARRWHRSIARLFGGAAAGIALVFALITWLDAAGFTTKLINTASSIFGLHQIGTLHVALVVMAATASGALISKWLASNLD